jgi:hypothetical protein
MSALNDEQSGRTYSAFYAALEENYYDDYDSEGAPCP